VIHSNPVVVINGHEGSVLVLDHPVHLRRRETGGRNASQGQGRAQIWAVKQVLLDGEVGEDRLAEVDVDGHGGAEVVGAVALEDALVLVFGSVDHDRPRVGQLHDPIVVSTDDEIDAISLPTTPEREKRTFFKSSNYNRANRYCLCVVSSRSVLHGMRSTLHTSLIFILP
jgi:hypothetical protein